MKSEDKKCFEEDLAKVCFKKGPSYILLASAFFHVRRTFWRHYQRSPWPLRQINSWQDESLPSLPWCWPGYLLNEKKFTNSIWCKICKKCKRKSNGLRMINLPFKVKLFEEYEIKFHDCCKWTNISSAFSAALRRKDPPTSHKSHTTSRTTKRWKPRQSHIRLKA